MRRTEEREGEEGVRKRGRLARSPPSLWTLLSLFARLTLQERSDTPCIMGGVNKKGVPKRERKNKITNVESCLNQVFFKLVNSVSFFANPPPGKCPCICDFNLSCKPQPGGKKKGQTKQLTLCHLGRLAWPRAQSLFPSLSAAGKAEVTGQSKMMSLDSQYTKSSSMLLQCVLTHRFIPL